MPRTDDGPAPIPGTHDKRLKGSSVGHPAVVRLHRQLLDTEVKYQQLEIKVWELEDELASYRRELEEWNEFKLLIHRIMARNS